MQLVLSWPVRLLVVAILAFSLFVDGAGYVYRIANHYPLTGNVQGLPPNFGGWTLYFHKGLDLAGGTHIDYQLTNFPAGQSRADVQQRTIQVINKRVNSLNVVPIRQIYERWVGKYEELWSSHLLRIQEIAERRKKD